MTPAVVLFDGVCNLCDASVQFIIRQDRRGRFRFAALQSSVGAELAGRCRRPAGDSPESVVLIDGDRCYDRSTAALHILRELRWPWPALYVFILVPAGVRDRVYSLIARNRYRWFGRRDACMLPTPALRSRFLDQEQPGPER